MDVLFLSLDRSDHDALFKILGQERINQHDRNRGNHNGAVLDQLRGETDLRDGQEPVSPEETEVLLAMRMIT